jgi:hypothetical protein
VVGDGLNLVKGGEGSIVPSRVFVDGLLQLAADVGPSVVVGTSANVGMGRDPLVHIFGIRGQGRIERQVDFMHHFGPNRVPSRGQEDGGTKGMMIDSLLNSCHFVLCNLVVLCQGFSTKVGRNLGVLRRFFGSPGFLSRFFGGLSCLLCRLILSQLSLQFCVFFLVKAFFAGGLMS